MQLQYNLISFVPKQLLPLTWISPYSARAVEAILQTGSRLEQWRKEPEATKSVCSIFGLVPGEDRLFANTILLRLAEAFQSGDKNIRLSVVRIFLKNIRCNRRKKNRKQRRAFLNGRVHNHEELLRRVKVVFDTGDIESRAMALVLFGCWADFAKDSAEIRYLVLSSMVSSYVLEVRLVSEHQCFFCENSNLLFVVISIFLLIFFFFFLIMVISWACLSLSQSF